MTALRTVEEWRSALRTALREAQRARQPHAMAVLRQTLAAIDNAEAADLSAAPAVEAGVIAGGVAGLGAGEVARRRLSPEAVRAIVEREHRELLEAAATLESLSKPEEAARLRLQADVLAALR